MRQTFNLGVKRYQVGAIDDYGNATETYGPVEDLPVFAVGPYGSLEPSPDRDETDTRVEVFCPPDTVLSPHDVLIHVGKDYEVIGVMSDYTLGPYGAEFGVVYVARRVEG